MKTPIFVGSLSEKDRETLQAGLRSKDAFTLRRSQMLLASSRGNEVPRIAEDLGSVGRADGARRHPRLQRKGRGCPGSQIFTSPANPRCRLRRGKRRGFEGLLHRSPTEFAGSSVVRITNISPFPGRSSNHALAISGLAYMT